MLLPSPEFPRVTSPSSRQAPRGCGATCSRTYAPKSGACPPLKSQIGRASVGKECRSRESPNNSEEREPSEGRDVLMVYTPLATRYGTASAASDRLRML